VNDPLDKLRAALAEGYEIEEKLGEGGMAAVYRARDLKHDRRVAIKVLRADLAASLGADRFLREIRITAKLSHPHVLPLYDSGEADGQGAKGSYPSTTRSVSRARSRRRSLTPTAGDWCIATSNRKTSSWLRGTPLLPTSESHGRLARQVVIS
jgi:serine/threonine protein kinase